MTKIEEKIPKGYKKTKVGVIPEDWEIMRFNDVAKIIDCKHRTPSYVETGVPLVSPGTIKWGELDLVTPKKQVTIEEYESLMDHCTVNIGDLVLSRNQSVGVASIVKSEHPFVLGQDTVLVQPCQINSSFLFYDLQSIEAQKQIFKLAGGSTFSRINLGEIRKLWLLFPPLSEQEKIAAVLSKWDEGIEKTEKLIVLKEKSKKALMQQLLTGKKRFPRFAPKGEVQDAKCEDGYPSDWNDTSIGKIVKQVKRPVVWDDDNLYSLISVRRRSGGLFLRQKLYGHEILTKNMSTAKEGDFLISKMQVLHGASGLTTKEFDGMHISGSYVSLVSEDIKVLDIEYFAWLAKTKMMYHKAYVSSYGVHIEKMTFNFKLYLKENICIPSDVEEQKAIVKVLDCADKEINILKQKLEELKHQKKGLMQQLLTGKTRVKMGVS